MAEKTKYWEKQVKEFCETFGLKPFFGWHDYNSYGKLSPMSVVLKYGRSTIQVPSKLWSSGFDTFRAEYDPAESDETIYMKLFQALSGKTLIWRWTEKNEPAPLGFVKIRKERVVKLPEFSSMEELKLKNFAAGVEL